MGIITTSNLTKNYGSGKGIFNVAINVKEGEVFGFLGPNGAGKTTTIRNLMGFIRPDKGRCSILGMDCFRDASKIQNHLGYLAGEIAFLDDMAGRKLLEFLADMKGVKNKDKMLSLMERFELDPKGRVKKMSKGMKQKIGIITAFMNDPAVLVLDEPTSGLDPLMQNRFVDLILEEKKNGKTIFMSSHIFEEIEKTCDRTAIIRSGKIAAVENMASLSQKKNKTYIFTLADMEKVKELKNESLNITEIQGRRVFIKGSTDMGKLLGIMSKYPVKDLDIKTQTLEEIFLHYYGKGNK